MWQHRREQIHKIEVRGLDRLCRVVDAGYGVLITPNHCAYSDPFLLFDASDQLGRPFYFMTAWQVFGTASRLKCLLLRQHGWR